MGKLLERLINSIVPSLFVVLVAIGIGNMLVAASFCAPLSLGPLHLSNGQLKGWTSPLN